jgi:hypothetical protein
MPSDPTTPPDADDAKRATEVYLVDADEEMSDGGWDPPPQSMRASQTADAVPAAPSPPLSPGAPEPQPMIVSEPHRQNRKSDAAKRKNDQSSGSRRAAARARKKAAAESERKDEAL